MTKIKRFLKLDLAREDFSQPSAIILILANIVPILGIIFLDWKVFPILLLYWTENLIVGFFNILKMALASPANGNTRAAKISIIPFFCVHYGIFALVHGIFVIVLFGGIDQGNFGEPDIPGIFASLVNLGIITGILALLFSHGASFVINYLVKGEYKEAKLNRLMIDPYSRVIILHVTIIFGGILLIAVGSPEAGIILLVVIKLGIDILAHLRQHARGSASLIKSRISGD
jgi:hypothetical protein